MDLTKITTPFGLLDAETQAALKAHGGPYEVFLGSGWLLISHPFWDRGSAYRVKPQPLTKPSIDWTHVAPKFKWLVKDITGSVYLYTIRPYADTDIGKWSSHGCGDIAAANHFASYTPGTCDWRDSLVQRPEGV